jgi:MerR family transcriptional regulator/heat shock protein HspR
MSSNEAILTISVAAGLIKLHPRTMMLYEKAGLITPYRTDTQRRLFSIKDLEHLQFIKYLTQKQKINLQGVRVVLEAISLMDKEGIKLRKILFPSFQPAKLI